MRSTTFDTFSTLAGRRGTVPVVREFSADTLTPITAYAALKRGTFAFLLESLVGGERWARYTFLGTEPREVWRYRKGLADRWTADDGWRPAGPAADPLVHIAGIVRARPAVQVPDLPRFTGGAVGYLGFDAVRAMERLPGGPTDDLGLPDAMFVLTDTVMVIDNVRAQAILVCCVDVDGNESRADLLRQYDRATGRIDELLGRLQTSPSLAPLPFEGPSDLPTTSPFAPDRFREGVARVKRLVTAGDAFQVVLSRRLDMECAAPPLDVYRSLRQLNPAPYLFLLELDGLSLAGSSPEVLVRVVDGEITVRPIAGTRPRGRDITEDAALADALLHDSKELAEHAMLVDLGRNDVGRVAQFGTVRVTADREIERYSAVQHIVSEVRGQLRRETDALDALRACFPAGTVSGAPKVRAMEILDELEPTRRGPYAGAVGYASWGGQTLDTAIAIRTAVLTDDRAHVQAGAGIVADSDPEREFHETQHKAQAVLRAIALAGGGSPSLPPADIFRDRGS